MPKQCDWDTVVSLIRQNNAEIKKRFALKGDLDTITADSGMSLDDLLAQYPPEVQKIYKVGESK